MAEDRVALRAVLVDVVVGKGEGHGGVSDVRHVKALGRLEVLGAFADIVADKTAPPAVGGLVGVGAVDGLAGEEEAVARSHVEADDCGPGR